MAVKGDTIKCHCGARLKLENDRIPWHKTMGEDGKPTRFNCQFAGVPAEEWMPEPNKPITVHGLTLSCPSCGSKGHVKNAPKHSMYPLECGACGEFDTLENFLAWAIRQKAKQSMGAGKHRFAG